VRGFSSLWLLCCIFQHQWKIFGNSNWNSEVWGAVGATYCFQSLQQNCLCQMCGLWYLDMLYVCFLVKSLLWQRRVWTTKSLGLAPHRDICQALYPLGNLVLTISVVSDCQSSNALETLFMSLEYWKYEIQNTEMTPWKQTSKLHIWCFESTFSPCITSLLMFLKI